MSLPPPPIDADFEKRWSAWIERGRVHDHLLNARLRWTVPMFAACVAIGLYLLVR